ncbi:hypothetical protein J6590_020233 [Homalodisca vitripennis]|nr:hypothetical protein J6590_020233 [Homalodisca vitripennis]
MDRWTERTRVGKPRIVTRQRRGEEWTDKLNAELQNMLHLTASSRYFTALSDRMPALQPTLRPYGESQSMLHVTAGSRYFTVLD